MAFAWVGFGFISLRFFFTDITHNCVCRACGRHAGHVADAPGLTGAIARAKTCACVCLPASGFRLFCCCRLCCFVVVIGLRGGIVVAFAASWTPWPPPSWRPRSSPTTCRLALSPTPHHLFVGAWTLWVLILGFRFHFRPRIVCSPVGIRSSGLGPPQGF